MPLQAIGKNVLEANASTEDIRVTSRVDPFRALSEASAEGDFVMLPRLLTSNERRLHVCPTLREDHQSRIADRSENAVVKFGKLSASVFSYFRGTALHFYRDLAGEDAWMPTVLTLGDVHSENFGIMPNGHNVPIFAVNDFDEACYARFTWDLKRGAVGFMIGAEEVAAYGRKLQKKIACAFVDGYVDGIRGFAGDSNEQNHELRIDNAAKLIRKLIENAFVSRKDWLLDDYLDAFKRGFRSDEDLVPMAERFHGVACGGRLGLM